MAKEATETAPAKAPAGPSKMVKVRLFSAIAFGGVAVRPVVDAKGKVTAVLAVIPRAIAEAHGPATCEIVADAPDNAKPGVVKE